MNLPRIYKLPDINNLSGKGHASLMCTTKWQREAQLGIVDKDLTFCREKCTEHRKVIPCLGLVKEVASVEIVHLRRIRNGQCFIQ